MNWTKILEILKNPMVQRILLLLMLIFCIFFWMKSCANYKEQINNNNNNFDAYKDTTRIIKLKNGQLEYERLLYMTESKDLKKYSDSLFTELEKEKKNVKIIVREKIIIHDNTIYVDSSKYRITKDSSYIIDWYFENTIGSLYRNIKGNSIFYIDNKRNLYNITSHLTNFNVCVDVITGIREIEKNKYATFVRTKDSTSIVSFEQIEGAIVDPSLFKNDNDWIIVGPFIGVGYMDKFGASVGLGVTIKLWGTHF